MQLLMNFFRDIMQLLMNRSTTEHRHGVMPVQIVSDRGGRFTYTIPYMIKLLERIIGV